MGITSDKEIAEMICGSNLEYLDILAPSLEESSQSKCFTQEQCLEYIGSKVRISRKPGTTKKPPVQEGMDALADLVVAHVPVDGFNFRQKALYVAIMIRRVIVASSESELVDDRDYVGNKRLELAGQLVAILFEDLFKTFSNQVKLLIDKTLQKQSRVGEVILIFLIQIEL